MGASLLRSQGDLHDIGHIRSELHNEGQVSGLPEEFDRSESRFGILPDQVGGHVLDGADTGLFLPGDAELADAVEALVGLDLDEEIIARSVVDGEGLDFGDFQRDFLLMRPSPPGPLSRKQERGSLGQA